VKTFPKFRDLPDAAFVTCFLRSYNKELETTKLNEVYGQIQLGENVALAQHGNIAKIRVEDMLNVARCLTVPGQLEFRLDNGWNEDSHGCSVLRVEVCNGSFICNCILGWGIGNSSDNIIEFLSE
jgi:hypothetical protein